jgi:hypothetical protein
MPSIHHTDASGCVDAWVIDRTLAGCAGRAADRGWYDLSVYLSQLATIRETAPRGITKIGAGWTMIAGEPGH